MTRKFNFIFDELVANENDVHGLIAYGLYKSKKIQYFKGYKEKNGKDITEDEIEKFHEISGLHIDQYKKDALTILHDFVNVSLEQEKEQLSEQYEDEFRKELQRFKQPFWGSVWASFIAAFVFAAFIGVVIIIMFGVRTGFWNTFTNIVSEVNRPPIESYHTIENQLKNQDQAQEPDIE